ncbi:MAG TPA: serine protease [Anaeromyxobacteraceae bacterium]|nr:serine protease [Anaeromyxobacteraceae bacterium]
MSDPIAAIVEALDAALADYDRAAASSVVNELIASLRRGTAVPPRTAADVLGKLRCKLLFDLVEPLAETLRFAGISTPRVRRQYAQAVIDRGNPEKAIDTLEALVEATRVGDPGEHAEAVGLLGRVYKQLYVDAVNADPGQRVSPLVQGHLRRALEYYSSVYDSAPTQHLWHGINAVALLARAAADGVAPGGTPRDLAAMASAILAEVASRGDAADTWDRATAMEACVALGRHGDALVWMARYVASKGADAFELNSTLRQLREVWRLVIGEPPGVELLPLLEAHLIRAQGGGRLTLPAHEVGPRLQRHANARPDAQVTLERTLGREGFVTLEWYSTGLERCLGVGQVRRRMDRAVGTGFLVRGGDLDPRLGDELLFLTNAHVVSDDPAVRQKRSALAPGEAVVVYDTWKGVRRERRLEFAVKRLLWTSPPDAPARGAPPLDATLLQLDPAPRDVAACPLADALPSPRKRVYVIGCPGGGDPCVSLHDNLLLDRDDRLLHYRAPTEGGSSGSPVFDDQWSAVGLHHGGGLAVSRLNGKSGTYAANEGITLRAIAGVLRGGPELSR